MEQIVHEPGAVLRPVPHGKIIEIQAFVGPVFKDQRVGLMFGVAGDQPGFGDDFIKMPDDFG